VIRARAVLLAATASGAALFVCARADAYCRTKACDMEPSYGDVWDEEPQPTLCVRNGEGCFTQGTPLYWPTNCLSFSVHGAGSDTSEIEYETAKAIIELAFEKWATVDCGDGQSPSFRAVNSGPVVCRQAEYNQLDSNANAFMFRDRDWPYRNAIDTLALTTVTYNVETAAIYDADVEMNSAEAPFTTTETPRSDAADFEAVVTHEVGHFLGLSHSEVHAATMRGIGYQVGTTGLRTLAPDDIAGICEIYPPGERLSSECSPRHGFTPECGKLPEEGCTLVARPGKASLAMSALAALFAIGLFARRSRRRTKG
jgi:hypothetical protein